MEICYLIAFPDADNGKPPLVEPFKGLKNAPYFQPIDIDLVTLGEETVLIESHAVAVNRQLYDGRVQMVECHFELKDPFAVSVLQERAKIQSALESKFIPIQYRQSGLYEEYTILLVNQAKPSPDKWIEKNGVKKIIYQSPWYKEGEYAGFVELSLEIPLEMPHFIRS